METMQIPLTESMKTFLETQATMKGFPSPGDYVQSVLANLEQREKEKMELEEKLLDGVRSPKVSGDAAFWRERRQKIFDQHPELEQCDKQNTQD
jgi:hypothetical protein